MVCAQVSSSSRSGLVGKTAEDRPVFQSLCEGTFAQAHSSTQSAYAKWVIGLLLCALFASTALARGLGRRSAELEKELREAARVNAASAARVKELDVQLARRFEVEEDMSERVTRHLRTGEEKRQVLAAEVSQLEEHLSQHDTALRGRLAEQRATLQEREKQANRFREELSMEKYHSEDLEGQLTSERRLSVDLKAQLNGSSKHLTSLQAQLDDSGKRLSTLKAEMAQRDMSIEALRKESERSGEALRKESERGGAAKLEAERLRAMQGQSQSELARERNTTAKLEAELERQKRVAVLLSTEVRQESERGRAAKLEAEMSRSELARERNMTAKLEAELDRQKKAAALLSGEVMQEQRSLVEQKELRASDIKVALSHLQAAEATNNALFAELAMDSQAAHAAARTYGRSVRELGAEAERARGESRRAAGELSGHLRAVRASAPVAERSAPRQRESDIAAPAEAAPRRPTPAAAGLVKAEEVPEPADRVQRLRDELAALEGA